MRSHLEAVLGNHKIYTPRQEYDAGEKIPLQYQTNSEDASKMTAKVRLTPYFSVHPSYGAKLLAIKATGCENTDLLHASSSSINMAVH